MKAAVSAAWGWCPAPCAPEQIELQPLQVEHARDQDAPQVPGRQPRRPHRSRPRAAPAGVARSRHVLSEPEPAALTATTTDRRAVEQEVPPTRGAGTAS